jgi:hypothetical protein
MTFWLRSGEFQKSGAAISASISASWDFLLGESKIAPHSFRLLAERRVFAFEFLDRHTLQV